MKISSGVSPEKIDEYKRVVLETLEDVSENGFPSEIVERTRNYMIGLHIMGFQDNFSIVNLLDQLEYENISIEEYLTSLNMYYDADADKLFEIFKKYFGGEYIFVSIVPEGSIGGE